MTKRALLIASPTEGLEGPIPDAERIAGLLEPRGFEIRRCIGPEATRKGILSGYQSLIEDTDSNDSVVIYYSGHGARSLDEEYTPPSDDVPRKRYHQFIVPVDLVESSNEDFRGILSVELSSLLGQLTAKTPNVTLIFDCCHSGGMTRDLRLRLKGLSKDWFTGAHAHQQRLKRGEVAGFKGETVSVTDNPFAVRLMAALPSQQAWEYEGSSGAYGILTDALIRAFEESEDRPATWNEIIRRVRELVQRLEPGQYPDIEGPSSRFVFDLEEADLTGIVPVKRSDDGTKLLSGRLLGIEPGDRYTIMPPGFQKVDSKHAIAQATVIHVSGAWSLVNLDPESAAQRLPAGAQAFPTSRTHHRRPVVVKASGLLRSTIEEAINESGLLRLLSDDETEASPDVLAVVEESRGQVSLRERPGLDLILPLDTTQGLSASVVENLHRLARARKLETLETGQGSNQLKAEYEFDWGRVVAGSPVPLPTTGAILFVGDRIFLRVQNNSRSMLYVSVFDVGLAGRILLLNKAAPSGYELSPDGAQYTLGYREPIGWKGFGPLSWPVEVPKDGKPRPESLVVIISDRPQDLRALESPSMAAPKGAEADRSDLQRIVDQLATGRTRDFEADDSAREVRYAVEHIRFMVDPTESPIHTEAIVARGRDATRDSSSIVEIPAAAVQDVATFLIDERPDPCAAYRRARGASAPDAVAVQLGEIVVHSNRALFSTDVRVDALVVTGGAKLEEAYRAGTARFERVRDGDRLPLDKLLVYHGPANGFLDLAVWISKDTERSLSLVDLLNEQLNSTEFKDAGLVLAGLAVAAPTAGTVIAGIGAAATMVNIAYKLVSNAVGKTIGLYRTSLLANERFGVGRHPSQGTVRAQDFSFWYEVSEID